jgi:hypothetical protein
MKKERRMMAHASRDPLFWATLAVSEQDFDGAGDPCIRWFDAAGNLLREDGEYGDLAVQMDLDGDGAEDTVRTLLDMHDPNNRV